MDPVRLACVKHAASVRPEPGSNSPSRTRRPFFGHEDLVRTDFVRQERSTTRGNTRGRWHCDPAGRAVPDLYYLSARFAPDRELTDSSMRTPKANPRTARTGVQSSLPFSRSLRSGTHSAPARGPDVGADSANPRMVRLRREPNVAGPDQANNLLRANFLDSSATGILERSVSLRPRPPDGRWSFPCEGE